MAHIRRHPKSPDRWQVRYVDPYGKERSKNFARKVDAEKYLHTVEVQKIRGEWTDPAAGKTRFGDWAIQVDATRPNRRDSTRARDSSYLRNLILPTFGDAETGCGPTQRDQGLDSRPARPGVRPSDDRQGLPDPVPRIPGRRRRRPHRSHAMQGDQAPQGRPRRETLPHSRRGRTPR